MGTRITTIEPPQGFAADASSAAVILASSHYGFPLSTTQVASGSIIGSGVGRRDADVRWSVAGRLALAWLITLPAAGLVGGAHRVGRRGDRRHGRGARDGRSCGAHRRVAVLRDAWRPRDSPTT